VNSFKFRWQPFFCVQVQGFRVLNKVKHVETKSLNKIVFGLRNYMKTNCQNMSFFKTKTNCQLKTLEISSFELYLFTNVVVTQSKCVINNGDKQV